LILSFVLLDAVGALALALPVSSKSGQSTPIVDAFFTATSAVCLTGLVVFDTVSYWSGFGQVVILLLIQLGGLGIMTGSTLLLLLVGRRVTLRDRLVLKAAVGSPDLGSTLELARRVAIFMGLAEAAGMIVLTARFSLDYELPTAVWMGMFHAVSAFNNAGFDLMGGFSSFQAFAYDPLVLFTLMALIVTGSVSYTLVEDLLRRRRFARLALDSKVVIVTTVTLIVLGTIGLLATEWRNPNTLGQMDLGPRLLNALFQSVSGRTAGFSSVNIGQMSEAGLLLLIGLMTIGGAAGSTAGGLKVQTLAIFCVAAISALRGLSHVEVFERRIPFADVLRSVSVAFLLLSVMFGTAFFLNLTERFFFVQDLFEAVSATGTVGLSTGITPETGTTARIALALTMLAGRLGPLALVLALTTREALPRYNWPEETVKLG